MKKILGIFAGIALFSVSCGDSNEPTPDNIRSAFNDMGDVVCNKMVECMEEAMGEFSEEEQEMARAMMPDADACLADMEATFDLESEESEAYDMTREELTAVRTCTESVKSASCEELQNMDMLPGCGELQTMGR